LLDKPWFVQADITELFARTISRLHHGMSISPLLDNRRFIQKLIDSQQSSGAFSQDDINTGKKSE